ncbi:MAG: histidine phosphatase family protein [Clostridia bacterium]|nr:histidine phosphatase family protein [Clostridia bacterium]
MKTTVVFVRHGETETNKANILCGHTDVNLSERGYKQAELGAKYLKKFKFDKIYSSDLTRAYRTAEAIAKYQNAPIIKDENLREIYCGDWECLTAEQLRSNYPESFGVYMQDFVNCQCPNGESGKDFIHRALTTVNKIAQENPGKTILIATHGGILRSLDAFMFTDKGWQAFAWYSNVGVSVAEYEDGKWTLLQRNYADYMGDLKTDLDASKV